MRLHRLVHAGARSPTPGGQCWTSPLSGRMLRGHPVRQPRRDEAQAAIAGEAG